METSASLLERLRTASDEAAWRRLDLLYRPLVRHWLRRDPALGVEADDVVQDVMVVLVRKLPGFQRERTGSVRCWLRTITFNCLGAHYRSRQHRPQALGSPLEESPLLQLEDPHSELSRLWDEEHDRHVLRRLMELIAPLFAPTTLAAFRRVVLDKVEPAQAAAELGLKPNAVLIAKSRVLAQLRQEAKGLIGLVQKGPFQGNTLGRTIRCLSSA